MRNINDVIYFLEKQQNDIDFYKREIRELENQIRELKSLPNSNVRPNPLPLDLYKENFNIGEINSAYQRTLMYEGIPDNGKDTILMTFIDFLNKTHHSLKTKK